MGKKYLWIIFILTIIVSVIALIPRYQSEKENDRVSLMLESRSVSYLEENISDAENDLLDKIKNSGISKIAVHKKELENIMKRDGVFFFSGSELQKIEMLGLDSVFPVHDFSFNTRSGFIYLPEGQNIEYFRDNLDMWKKKLNAPGLRIEPTGDIGYVIFFPEWEKDYVELKGFDLNRVQKYTENGFAVVPVFTDPVLESDFFRTFVEDFSAGLFMFTETRDSNYDSSSEAVLSNTADFMNRFSVTLAYIEPFLTGQKFSRNLAEKIDYNLVRTHILHEGEMERYNHTTLTSRYIRAVRERNSRLLYIRAFRNENTLNSGELLSRNEKLWETMVNEINKTSYEVNGIQAFRSFYGSTFLLFLIFLLVTVLITYFTDNYSSRKFSQTTKISFVLLAVLFFAALLLLGQVMLLRQMTALMVSIFLPIFLMFNLFSGSGKLTYIKAGFSFLGAGIITAACLNHISFSQQIMVFRGVKLSFVLPVILIGIFAFKEYSAESDFNLKSLLDFQPRVKHFLAAGLLFVIGVIFILRTGNFPLISVPAVEIRLRELLENVFVIRPRFKEIFIGYPALVLALGLKDKMQFSGYYYLLLTAASLVPINIVNSFTHIHTPLLVSLHRTINGFIVGTICGLLLLAVVNILRYLSGIISAGS